METPAAANTRSIFPNFAIVPSTNCFTCCSSETSVGITKGGIAEAGNSFFASSSFARSLPEITKV